LALYAAGEFKLALTDFDKALSLDPGAAIYLFDRAECKSRLGDKIGAIKDYRTACELDASYLKNKIVGLTLCSGNDTLDAATSQIATFFNAFQNNLLQYAQSVFKRIQQI
jgi:tetratricopeptide (TPR) repeat protein